MYGTLPVTITGTGSYLPDTRIPSTVFDQRFGRATGWSEKRYGIRSRAVAVNEQSSEMATSAAIDALQSAGLDPEDLDLIVSASSLMEQPIPTMAVQIQNQLGLCDVGTPVLDINATCLGFVSALDTISYAIAAGRYGHVLIVCSELPSRGLNWDDPEASIIFGDGAAAAVVSRSPSQKEARIIASSVRTFSDGAPSCQFRAGGTRINPHEDIDAFLKGAKFELDGKSAFKVVAKHIDGFVQSLLDDAGLCINDIDVVIPHQASALALHHLRSRLGIAEDRMIDIFSNHGNQVSASIPTALHRGVMDGRISRGDTALLIGTSAGISIGGMVLEY